MARADWVYVILSSEVFKVVCITNKKTVSIHASYGQCFFLGTCFHSYFNSSLQDPLQCLKSLFRVYGGRFLSYRKKRKIGQNGHSLSFVGARQFLGTHCLSLRRFVGARCVSLWRLLSLVVPLIVIRCRSLWLLVVARCIVRLSFRGRSSDRGMSGFLLKYPNFFSFFFSCVGTKPPHRQIVLLLVRPLVNSLSANNNLVPFHLWWR